MQINDKETLMASVINWTNTNWPELAAAGGLESIEYKVVKLC